MTDKSLDFEVNVSDSPRLKPATPLNPRRYAIVVGASVGMGAALSKKLAKEGYAVALVARQKDKLKELCAEIDQAAGETRALAYVHDVSNYKEVPALLKKIVADLGGLDTFIFMAGVNYPPGGMDKYNFDNDRQMVEVNLIGAMAWLTPVAEMFQNAKAGQIVGIGSVAGDRGRVGNPGYNTSKAGVHTYLEALRNRLTRHGVSVLTVKPGFVKTEMLKAAVGPTPFAIPVEKAVDDIYKAMRKRKQTVYTPFFWAYIMFVIRHIPSFIFRRLSF